MWQARGSARVTAKARKRRRPLPRARPLLSCGDRYVHRKDTWHRDIPSFVLTSSADLVSIAEYRKFTKSITAKMLKRIFVKGSFVMFASRSVCPMILLSFCDKKQKQCLSAMP